jgi:4-alpha-glucanotransferase
MMRLLGILLALGALLGASALATERFDDRELFVSPPDAVAEQFVRAVVSGRYDQARAYLAEESSASEDELRALRAKLGDPSEVEAQTLSRDDTRALATVRVSSVEKSEAVSFTLVFDEEWKIDL